MTVSPKNILCLSEGALSQAAQEWIFRFDLKQRDFFDAARNRDQDIEDFLTGCDTATLCYILEQMSLNKQTRRSFEILEAGQKSGAALAAGAPEKFMFHFDILLDNIHAPQPSGKKSSAAAMNTMMAEALAAKYAGLKNGVGDYFLPVQAEAQEKLAQRFLDGIAYVDYFDEENLYALYKPRVSLAACEAYREASRVCGFFDDVRSDGFLRKAFDTACKHGARLDDGFRAEIWFRLGCRAGQEMGQETGQETGKGPSP